VERVNDDDDEDDDEEEEDEEKEDEEKDGSFSIAGRRSSSLSFSKDG
jgi:hypothetical protein